MTIKMDASEHGLEMFFKPYQVETIQYLQQLYPEGANSKKISEAIKQTADISRTSINSFLNAMVDDGILTYTEVLGRGGYPRVYTIRPDLISYIVETILTKMQQEFPDEARKALKEIELGIQ